MGLVRAKAENGSLNLEYDDFRHESSECESGWLPETACDFQKNGGDQRGKPLLHNPVIVAFAVTVRILNTEEWADRLEHDNSDAMETIQSFVQRTLAAEKQAAINAEHSDERSDANVVRQLRSDLEKALERDDSKAAIKLTHSLMEYLPGDEEIEDLHLFLLDRVGVAVREPVFGFSAYPPVTYLSATLMLLMICGSIYSLLTEIGDPWLSLGPAIVCTIPLVDLWWANHYNRRNEYRLR